MRILKVQLQSIAAAAVGIAVACGCVAAHAQTTDHYQNFSSANLLKMIFLRFYKSAGRGRQTAVRGGVRSETKTRKMMRLSAEC